ncbi:MAG: AAA family ATPase, partial [Saprospiraceae bacterium]
MLETVRKVLITGVESTGKSTLTAALAAHYDTIWIPEYARQYLEQLNRNYVQADLLKIAQGQVALEEEYLKKA